MSSNFLSVNFLTYFVMFRCVRGSGGRVVEPRQGTVRGPQACLWVRGPSVSTYTEYMQENLHHQRRYNERIGNEYSCSYVKGER